MFDILTLRHPREGNEHVARTWCVWSSNSPTGKGNLEFGLDTNTWGFRNRPEQADPTEGDYLIFGMQHSQGNVRVSAQNWQRGTANLIVAQVTADLFQGRAPHWPDEIDQQAVIYPYRFGFIALGQLASQDLSGNAALPAAVSEGLRLCATGNRPVLVHVDLTQIIEATGATPPPPSDKTDLSGTAGRIAAPASGARTGTGSNRQGRSSDPKLTKAVEEHAEALAIRHMQTLGWAPSEITKLGKPFDLVCANATTEKHVEVKGTTGAGGEVEYTPNEVNHFRTCPHGADLIVVRDITVDRTTDPYTASGGTLLHAENYRAPQADLQAVRWLGRVTGWETP